MGPEGSLVLKHKQGGRCHGGWIMGVVLQGVGSVLAQIGRWREPEKLTWVEGARGSPGAFLEGSVPGRVQLPPLGIGDPRASRVELGLPRLWTCRESSHGGLRGTHRANRERAEVSAI